MTVDNIMWFNLGLAGGACLTFLTVLLACKFKTIKKFMGYIGVPRFAPIPLREAQLFAGSASHPVIDLNRAHIIFTGLFASDDAGNEFNACVMAWDTGVFTLCQYTQKQYTYWNDEAGVWRKGQQIISTRNFNTIQELKEWLERRQKDPITYRDCRLAGANSKHILDLFSSIEHNYDLLCAEWEKKKKEQEENENGSNSND